MDARLRPASVRGPVESRALFRRASMPFGVRVQRRLGVSESVVASVSAVSVGAMVGGLPVWVGLHGESTPRILPWRTYFFYIKQTTWIVHFSRLHSSRTASRLPGVRSSAPSTGYGAIA